MHDHDFKSLLRRRGLAMLMTALAFIIVAEIAFIAYTSTEKVLKNQERIIEVCK